MKWYWRLMDALDGIEFTVCGIVAAVIVFAAPLFFVARLAMVERYVAAVTLGLFWGVCVAACVRDFRRRSFSWWSGVLVAAWFGVTFWVSWVLTG